LAATSAFAQSSVTIAGRIDAGISQRTDTAATGVETKVTANNHGGINSPFLAIKGAEDLGGGLKAEFFVETGILGADANKFGDRGSNVSLSGGFGKVTVGNQLSGAREVFAAYDTAGAINVAGSLNSSTGADAGGVGSHLTTFAQALKYTTPTMGGLTLAASHNLNNTNYSDTTADTKTGQGSTVGGQYVNGPLSIGASYASGKNVTATANQTVKTTALGASYDLKVAQLFLTHFKLDSVDTIGTTSATTNIQRKSTSYGLRVPVTAQLQAFAAMGTGKLQTGASSAFEGDIKGTQMGLNYSFSKRTTAKFAYGTTKRDVTATTETKVKETAVALVHVF
jgi:predicted porin